MSYRAKRYVDSEPPLVQRSGPQFPLTFDFPFAKKAASTNFQTVKLLLQEERARMPRYDQVWQYATAMFNQKKNDLRNQGMESIPDECHIAIIAYTFEKVINASQSLEIYVDFNKKSRELKDESSWARFPYKSLYCLLTQSVKGVRSTPDVNKPAYYRGVSFHYSPDFPDEQLLVDFGQFTSFTKDRKEAEEFIKSKGDKGTLLVLPYPPMAAIGIANYSQFEYEKEILICPWSTFSIGRARTEGRIHEIVLTSEGPYFEGLTYTIAKQAPMSLFPNFSQMFNWS